ncbi:MAG: alpha/beta hydrolase [Hyphomicrobiaceae bacterium]|nr:alpha/beta hydrolase [Hyphomicrobiaceae bacterium]
MRGLRRVAVLFAGLAGFSYAGVAGAMYAMQRDMLFNVRDTGDLSKPGTLAIAGGERVKITTPDGEQLAGWYLAPRQGQPVFLFLHGKGGGLERKSWRWKRIREHGAGVLAISYRGYPGSTGTPSEAGLMIDGRAAYDWLRGKGHAASDIVLHGLSLGTGVAVKLAAEVQAKALILEAPYTAVVDVAAERYPWLPVRLLMHDQFLTRERIGKIAVPVLIAHGTRDTVIPFEQGERLFALAPEPKVMARMEGSDHSTLTRDGIYEKHIWPFLQRY